ncbi:4Fe-4S binding protein [Anaerotruncus colihominis]|uniref:4Fe-4S binding protein n=1 Tax=Anaerotruncus colihominis TaxID=169435 RepID=UPI0026EC3597|nr:4Fe-4S binding protein [Anaerotruncus colihominis]
MYQTVHVFYFSPTGGVQRVARALADALTGAPEFFDLSDPDVSVSKADGGTLALFAVPVFAGRVPAPAREAMRRIAGAGAPAVAVAIYGNRAFDDALLELCDLLTEQNFVPVAAGAFIAEHSMLRTVAAGRPDARDIQEIKAFAAAVKEKISGGVCSPVSVPGSRPYCAGKPLPLRPQASDGCVRCGLCARRCPVGAIPPDAPDKTGAACILCMRCVAVCPHQARALPPEGQVAVQAKLGGLTQVRRENQTWL